MLGLSGLNSAFAFAWLSYNLWLVKLLAAVGISAAFAATLLLIESLLAVVLEPLVGFGSDRTFRALGTRWPFIVVGTIAAGAVLAAIPLFVLPGASTGGAMRGVMVGALIAWSMAMTVFRTPALALLGRYSSLENAPVAAIALSVGAALVATLRPAARDWLVSFGPLACLGAASGVLLLSAGCLFVVDRAAHSVEREDPTPTADASRLRLAALVAAGAASGIATKMIFGELLPRIIVAAFGGALRDRVLTGVFILLAVACPGAGFVAKRVTNDGALLVGAGLVALLAPALAFAPVFATGFLGAVLVLLFSLIANGFAPLALSRAPRGRAGLGFGMYFGGAAAGSALFAWLVPKTEVFTAEDVALIAAGALAVLCAAVLVSRPR